MRQKARAPFSDEMLADVLISDDDVERTVLHSISVEELRAALKMLNQEAHDLLIMKYYLFMDNEEIGKELGLKANSVRMKLTRARREVLRLLNNKE